MRPPLAHSESRSRPLALARSGALRPWTRRLALFCALLGCLAGQGCASMPVAGFTKFPNPFAKNEPDKESDATEGSLKAGKGVDEYEAALALFNQAEELEGKERDEKLTEAEKAMTKVIKTFKKNPVMEDAYFTRGEIYFAQKRYAYAQDDYNGMFKEAPTTRHTEKATRRLFTIATIWLNADGSEKSDALIQVNAEDVIKQDTPVRSEPRSNPLKPNFWKKSEPLFDTKGRALQALKSVWEHDPTGPLADDALMMTAAYHLRSGDYREADYIFGLMREDEQYRKGEYATYAYVLGSHVKHANYQGPRYNGKILDDADTLLQTTINMYPDSPHREKLEAEVAKIKEQAAERDWVKAEFFRKKGNKRAQATYCELLLLDHPNSSYAEKARETLAKLDPKYRNGIIREYPQVASTAKAKPLPQPAGRAAATDQDSGSDEE